MGKRGPKKKLRALELLDGSPSHRTKKELAEVLGVDAWGKLFTPEHLTEDAKACIAIIESSMPPEIYRTIDSFALAAFGMAWAIHKRASIEIGKPRFDWISRGRMNSGPVAMDKDTKRSGKEHRHSGRPSGSRPSKQAELATARANQAEQIRRPDWSGIDRAQRVIDFIEKRSRPAVPQEYSTQLASVSFSNSEKRSKASKFGTVRLPDYSACGHGNLSVEFVASCATAMQFLSEAGRCDGPAY